MPLMKEALGRVGILLILLTLTVPSWANPFAEPIARAAKGQVQCYSPDTAAKTCSAMATFKAAPDGGVTATAVILISPSPLILMTGHASGAAKNGELCGVLTEKNIEDATFTTADGELPPTQATMLRKLIEAAVQNVFGHELCGAYTADGATLKASPKLDGAPMQSDGLPMIWVSPSSGYKTAP